MVAILDSTLREGEQTPGVCFPAHAKLAIARALEEVGVDYVEAGHPAVSPAIAESLTRLSERPHTYRLAAHARSLEADVDAALACGADLLGVFYCVSRDRLDGVFKRSLAQAVDQIAGVIRYAKEQRPELLVRYTPEDTVRSDFDDVVAAAATAVHAGADIISIADTTGHMVPRVRSLHDYLSRLREGLADRGAEPLFAVHCHDDRGLALANALDAHAAGVDVIDASVLGIGERAGIVDLASLLAVLDTDHGVEGYRLSALPDLYAKVSGYAGIPIPVTQPVTGANAFTHCAGVHTHAATKNPVHYQSLDPARFGRRMLVSLDHMSGVSSVRYALDRLEVEHDEDLAREVLEAVKAVGAQGRTVSADELRDIVSWVRE